MFPVPPHSLPQLLLSLLAVLGVSLCMQTIAFDIRNGNSPGVEVQCIEKERQALLNVKKDLLDPSHRLSSWVKEVNCCQWKGVKCNNRTGHVLMLDLHNPYVMIHADDYALKDDNTSLGGEISSSLLDLQYLQHLDLSFNNFSSNPIPEFFGSLVQLHSLNLSSANFAGRIPHQIGNLSNLNYLDLSNMNYLSNLNYLDLSNMNHLYLIDSYITFEAPSLFVNNLDWLSCLRSLIYLDMSGINISLTSNLFNNIYRLPSLKHLRLSQCGLDDISSSSPSSYLNRGHANLTSIKYIDLSRNDLSCTIFKTLGNATSVLYLDLSLNLLECSIPRLLEQMQSLDHLDLSSNQLKGRIPTASLAILSSLTFIDFLDNKLEGWVPVFNVSFPIMAPLAHLDISGNNLKGPIPDFLGNITSLTYLDLSNNYLEGGIPSILGKLCNLQTLNLRNSNLIGDITDELWSGCISNSLEDLDLSFNELYGHLPEDLGRFSSLRMLDLSENRLNGCLSTSIGQLTDLVELDVSSNFLEGVISESHLSCLSKLRNLYLSNNSLSITLSFDWTPPFQLEKGYFRSCWLGPRFPLWLQTQKNISHLDISDNGINDTIPIWFWNISSNMDFLNLSFNHIYGQLPTLSLALLKNISTIDLSSNLLDGSIPGISPSTKALILSNNSFSGTLSDLLCNVSSIPDSLLVLDLSSNLLEGSIPRISDSTKILILSNNSFSGTLSDILCNVSSIPNSLFVLDLSENQLSGLVPNCLNYWRQLSILNLGKNKFSGEIPNSIGFMDDLRSLHFNGNTLSGVLPLSLKNCTLLVVIDVGENMFSGEIPPWIGENLAHLRILRLHSNEFIGNIPSQLCQITNLQILDLAHNNLQGIIPRCLINITKMSISDSNFLTSEIFQEFGDNHMVVWKTKNFLKAINVWERQKENTMVVWKGLELGYQDTRMLVKTIDLSSNNLSGEIPREMMNLVGLCSLNLSRNNLVGKIPGNIGNLSSLESLDFSRNHLSGVLPVSMANLNFLGTLDLSFNNFSGRIPQSTQLQSFNAASYMENSGLCGPPLSANCTTNDTSSQGHDHHSTRNEGGIDIPWFYIGMAMGYIVGFWIACGILLFNRSWRKACFCYVEKVHDWFYVALIVNARKLQRKFGN